MIDWEDEKRSITRTERRGNGNYGKLLRSGKTEHKVAVRLLIVTNRAKGKGTTEIAEILGTSLKNISRIVKRYNAEGLRSLLQDKTRKPGTAPISEEKKNEICVLVCTGKPKNKTHWSVRDIAKQTGVGKSSVSIILRERNIQPHRVKKFQYSTDKQFKEKLEDVVGLYMNPPDNSIVLCVDEKSQIQALERTQPVLPLRENMPERQTADYERHWIYLPER
jgi:transposase